MRIMKTTCTVMDPGEAIREVSITDEDEICRVQKDWKISEIQVWRTKDGDRVARLIVTIDRVNDSEDDK